MLNVLTSLLLVTMVTTTAVLPRCVADSMLNQHITEFISFPALPLILQKLVDELVLKSQLYIMKIPPFPK